MCTDIIRRPRQCQYQRKNRNQPLFKSLPQHHDLSWLIANCGDVVVAIIKWSGKDNLARPSPRAVYDKQDIAGTIRADDIRFECAEREGDG